MIGSRTLAKIVHRAREIAFRAGGFQNMLDANEMVKLEWEMGFPGMIPEHRRFQMELLKSEGLKPEHKFLEIGPGPMTGGIPVIEYLEPGKYTGVDVRASVMDLSWEQIGKHKLSGKNPRLIVSGNFGDETVGAEAFDFILSFSVLYHLSDEILSGWFATVAKRLTPNGRALANINTSLDSDRWLQFPFLKRTVDDYADVAGRHGLATENLGPIGDLGFRLTSAERDHEMLRFTRA